MKRICGVILAGGLSKRIISRIPKVFHKVSGKMMIEWAIERALEIEPYKIFVVGNSENKDELLKVCKDYRNVEVVLQEVPKGTGDAVKTIRDLVDADSYLYVAPGDAPLIKPETIRRMWETISSRNAQAIILTADVPNPYGYGRIIRKGDKLERIVEHKDATLEERKISEVNGGFYIFKNSNLFDALEKITPNNSQGEYYLTDVFQHMNDVIIYKTEDWKEILGVNTRKQLAEVERYMQERIKERFMEKGITFIMPETIYVEYSVNIGEDTVIYPNVALLGKTVIGRNCVVGPCRVLKDKELPDNTVLLP